MSGLWIIFRREVGQFFTSLTAYLIAAAFLLLTAIPFNYDLAASITIKPASPAVIPNFLSFGLVLFAPVLTMRMLAEESREGTLELLLTAPVSDSSIVLGKFLASWFYYTILLFLTLAYQVILANITSPDMGHAISAYLGIWLYGGASLAVGLFFSAVTENQVVAAFLSISTLTMLYLSGLVGQIVANVDLARIINALTLPGHYSSSFAYGLFRAEDVAYYAGIMVIMLFITIRVVESHRWRG